MRATPRNCGRTRRGSPGSDDGRLDHASKTPPTSDSWARAAKPSASTSTIRRGVRAGRSRGRSARRSVCSAVERTGESSSNLPGTSCRNGTRVRAPPPSPFSEAECGRSRQRYTPLVRLRVPVSWIAVQALIIARWYYELLITYLNSEMDRFQRRQRPDLRFVFLIWCTKRVPIVGDYQQ